MLSLMLRLLIQIVFYEVSFMSLKKFANRIKSHRKKKETKSRTQ